MIFASLVVWKLPIWWRPRGWPPYLCHHLNFKNRTLPNVHSNTSTHFFSASRSTCWMREKKVWVHICWWRSCIVCEWLSFRPSIITPPDHSKKGLSHCVLTPYWSHCVTCNFCSLIGFSQYELVQSEMETLPFFISWFVGKNQSNVLFGGNYKV